MAFKITEREAIDRWVEAAEPLWLTADREKVVAEGDPDAAFLFASPGKRISRDEAERYGLVKAKGKAAAADPDEPQPARRASRKRSTAKRATARRKKG